MLAARRRPARRGSSRSRVRFAPAGDEMASLTNAERRQAGLTPFTSQLAAMQAAQIHANQMASVGQMAHVLPGAQVPGAAGSTGGRWLPLAGVRGERGVRAGKSRIRHQRLDGIVGSSRQHSQSRTDRARHGRRARLRRPAVLRAGLRQSSINSQLPTPNCSNHSARFPARISLFHRTDALDTNSPSVLVNVAVFARLEFPGLFGRS